MVCCLLLFPGEKTSICGGARDRSMVLPVRGPLGFTFRSDANHVRISNYLKLSVHVNSCFAAQTLLSCSLCTVGCIIIANFQPKQ